MDKLQPIIKHRFWILAGLAVILITVGWYMGVGDLQKKIDERKGALDAAEAAAKSVGPNPPNESWVTAVSAILKEKETGLKKTEQVLFEEQKQLRFYPPQVTANMQRVLVEAGKKQTELEYRQQPPPKLISLYRTDYFDAVDQVIAGLEPYNAGNVPQPNEPGANLYANIPPGEGKVYLNWQPHPFIPKLQWLGANSQPPTPKEFWDSLEDLWLIDALFKSINRVNEGYRNVTDAPIKQIDQLLLRGGNMEEVIARKAGGGAPASPTGDMMGGEMMEYTGPMGSPFEQGGGEDMMGGNRTEDTKIDYDLAVDFGSDADTSAQSTTTSAEMTPMTMSRGRQTQARKRYVEDDPGKPYRTRAFALKVVMDEYKMPELIHQLRSSPWPIHIYRVHRADYNLNTFGPTQSYGSEYGGEMSPEMSNPMATFSQPMASPFTQPFTQPFSQPGQPGQTYPGQEAKNKLKAALTDPNIIQVLITGTITMYKSPVVAEEVGTETTPDTTTPPADPNAPPADPNAPPADPNAPPADPNAPPADPNATPATPMPENPLPGNVPMPLPENPLPGNVPMPLPGNVPMPLPENTTPNPALPTEIPGTVPPATPSETPPVNTPPATPSQP